MPPADFKYDLPSAAPPSVVREDTIEYGFIGTLHGRGLKTLGISPHRAMEQIASSKNDPGNGYTKTPDGALGLSSFVIQNSSFDISPQPYQVYAVQQMVKCIEEDAGNGYVWHTTGSGKTLTSFNASTLLKDNEFVRCAKAKSSDPARNGDFTNLPYRGVPTKKTINSFNGEWQHKLSHSSN